MILALLIPCRLSPEQLVEQCQLSLLCLLPASVQGPVQSILDRLREGENLSAELTCLILRIWANSAQFLPLDNVLRRRFEMNLHDSGKNDLRFTRSPALTSLILGENGGRLPLIDPVPRTRWTSSDTLPGSVLSNSIQDSPLLRIGSTLRLKISCRSQSMFAGATLVRWELRSSEPPTLLSDLTDSSVRFH